MFFGFFSYLIHTSWIKYVQVLISSFSCVGTTRIYTKSGSKVQLSINQVTSGVLTLGSWLSLSFCTCLLLNNSFLTHTFSYTWQGFTSNLCSDLLLLESSRVITREQTPLIQHRTCSKCETQAQMQAFKTMPVIPAPSVANSVSLHRGSLVTAISLFISAAKSRPRGK